MPTRHISNNSFDEILSDLGDDPAIPDPHGIRKPHAPKFAPSQPTNQGKGEAPIGSLNRFQIQNLMPKLGNSVILLMVLIAALAGYFVASRSDNGELQVSLEEAQKLILELKKDLSLMRTEIEEDQDNLYLLIDELEVSIHSLKNKRPETKVLNKFPTIPHEAELRRWRFLGAAQMGDSHQAFFDTGNRKITSAKGAQILGDWRLSNIEKDLATLTHPQGKTLVIKASKGQ